MDEIEINGEKYVKKSKLPTGKRCVVVVDKGWIFAGDVTEKNNRIVLDRAVLVFRWESIGFDGLLKNPDSEKADIRPVTPVDIPIHSEVYRVPVHDNWGLKSES